MATVQELKAQGYVNVATVAAVIQNALNARVRAEALRAAVEADFPGQGQIIADLAQLRDDLDNSINTLNDRLNDLTGILAAF